MLERKLRALTAYYPTPPASLRSKVLIAWAQEHSQEPTVFKKFWLKLQWYWIPAISLATLVGGYLVVNKITGWSLFSKPEINMTESEDSSGAQGSGGKIQKSIPTETATGTSSDPVLPGGHESNAPTGTTSQAPQNSASGIIGSVKKGVTKTPEAEDKAERSDREATKTTKNEDSNAMVLFTPIQLEFEPKTRRLTWNIDPLSRENGLRAFEVHIGKDAAFTAGAKSVLLSPIEFSTVIDTDQIQFFVKVSALYSGRTTLDSDPLLASIKPKIPTLTAFYVYYFRRAYGRWVWPETERVAIPTPERYAEIQVKYQGEVQYFALYRIFDQREFVILNYDPSRAARLRIAYRAPDNTWLYGPEFRFCPGDINLDHLVNQEDIRLLSLIPEGTRTPETKPELFSSADLNGDSVITPADRAIIDAVLAGTSEFSCP